MIAGLHAAETTIYIFPECFNLQPVGEHPGVVDERVHGAMNQALAEERYIFRILTGTARANTVL